MFVYLMMATSTDDRPHVDRLLYVKYGFRGFSPRYFCISRQEWENQGGE